MSILDAFEDHDALGLAALISAGDVTPGELLDAALARADVLNGRLNALVLLQEDVARRHIDEGLPKGRSEEHTSELQSRENLVCRLLLEKKILKTYTLPALQRSHISDE